MRGALQDLQASGGASLMSLRRERPSGLFYQRLADASAHLPPFRASCGRNIGVRWRRVQLWWRGVRAGVRRGGRGVDACVWCCRRGLHAGVWHDGSVYASVWGGGCLDAHLWCGCGSLDAGVWCCCWRVDARLWCCGSLNARFWCRRGRVHAGVWRGFDANLAAATASAHRRVAAAASSPSRTYNSGHRAARQQPNSRR